MSEFEATTPVASMVGIVVVMAVIVCIAWLMADQQLDGAKRTLARLILVAGLVGGAFGAIGYKRAGIRVQNNALYVTFPYELEAQRYTLDQVRAFKSESRTVGVGVRSRLEEFLVLDFSDGRYLELPVDLPNARRLKTFLSSNVRTQ